MNGEPLSADHGFPLRVIVPGTIGARSVKWLSRIVVSKNEYPGFWQQKDYKMFSPTVEAQAANYDSEGASTPAGRVTNRQPEANIAKSSQTLACKREL